MTPVAWLLTVEPLGKAIAWSLLRRDPDGSTDLRDAGYVPDTLHAQGFAAGLDPTRASSLWAGDLGSPAAEERAAGVLGEALLPEALRTGIATSPTPTIAIATRGWPAKVPWDLLALWPGGPRLVEYAHVLGAVSPVTTATRARTAPPADGDAPGLALVDPGPVGGAVGPLYPEGPPRPLLDQLTAACDDVAEGGSGCTAEDLQARLSGRPARFLYVGHVRSAGDDAPAATALTLRGEDPLQPRFVTAREWLAHPDRWPAPPRVALIGCASDDAGHAESSGLVTAAVNAGAHLVTSTRWPLPTDHPEGRALSPHQPVIHRGLTDLAAAVHHAHTRRDPVATLRAWQLQRLQAWRTTGALSDSPLLWASLISYQTIERTAA